MACGCAWFVVEVVVVLVAMFGVPHLLLLGRMMGGYPPVPPVPRSVTMNE